MTNELLETVKDGVAVLTMNRPDRLNAMSGEMLDAMLASLERLASDPDVGVVVLTGAGRGFCAGGDVKAMAEGREFGGDTMEDKAQGLRAKMETSRWLHEMPKPTIAMVRGAAAGAGLSLAMACDLRIASDNARFATAFARAGYSRDFGGRHPPARGKDGSPPGGGPRFRQKARARVQGALVMAPLPDILGSLEAEAKKVYARIASKRGRIGGPFAALMHHPPLAERVAAVGEYLRYDATLPGDIRELAIIITARHVFQPYEWVAHAAIAIREGLPEEIVEQVRTRRDLST